MSAPASFVALDGASFGRCDLRVDAAGTPYMLEINPNCGVYYPPKDAGSADLCLLHDPEGHAGFTRRLIGAALRRHSSLAPPELTSQAAVPAARESAVATA